MAGFWILGVLIIGVLAAVAGYLQFRLYQVKKHQREREVELESLAQAKRRQLNDSIQIICRALLARQVEYAEASIRISGLLNALGVAESERTQFVAFDKMADSIKHIPTLTDWNALPKAERVQYRRQIEIKEQEFADFLDDAARKLLDQSF